MCKRREDCGIRDRDGNTSRDARIFLNSGYRNSRRQHDIYRRIDKEEQERASIIGKVFLLGVMI